MAEQARDKGGNSDIRGFAARREHGVTAQRQFADIKLLILKRSMERFFRLKWRRHEFDPVDLYSAIYKRMAAIVIAAGHT
jgi:hypothetical protein